MRVRAWVKMSAVASVLGVGIGCGPVSASFVGDQGGVTATGGVPVDRDGDGIPDSDDNCADIENADQLDLDQDDLGDACDDMVDLDGDAVHDPEDNCPGFQNEDQADMDEDGAGDVCDNCPDADNADQADADADGIGDACPCDACDATEWCETHPGRDEVACLEDCPNDRRASDQTCCPLGARADDDGSCPLPDLGLDEARIAGSAYIDTENIDASDCQYVEGCVSGTGNRTVLRFDTTTPNYGPGDMHLGDPAGYANFVWSPCHGHYHFESYAAYEVRDPNGVVVAPGHKQAFCLMDWENAQGVGYWQASGEIYDCGYQGIQADWADTYGSYLDCQFVDITDVPPGDYTLFIHVNFDKDLAEADYDNNTVEIPFVIP